MAQMQIMKKMKGTKIDTFKSRVLLLFQIIQIGNTGNINVILVMVILPDF